MLTLGAGQLVIALIAFRLALSFRHTRPDGGYQIDVLGSILIFAAAILLGVSVPMLLRSPFRMPLGERLFRLTWLSPFGRLFVRVSGRRAWNRMAMGGTSTVTGSRVRAQPPPMGNRPSVQVPIGADDRVTTLETRVAELERWRK